MLKKSKKGFTIVELVIVIAVIGILSAILIPTFANLTIQANDTSKRANLANAYSAYISEAADGVVDANGHEIKLVGQNEVFLLDGASDTSGYVFKDTAEFKGWNLTKQPAASGYHLTLVAAEADAKYNGFYVAYSVAD